MGVTNGVFGMAVERFRNDELQDTPQLCRLPDMRYRFNVNTFQD
jgi:hypothetical protein